MPESGFRAAQAYVEVTARLDDDKVLAAARRAAEGMDATLREGGERAGRSLTSTLAQAGADAGAAMVGSTEGRLRDASGRFVGAGKKLGEDVGKGAGEESDRNGFRAFLGLVKSAPKAGLEAATGLVGALKQGISGPAGPYLIAGLSAGAVVAGPLIGAVLAGGIMAGIAAAGIGAGIALAAKDPEVRHAFSQMGSEVGAILKNAASPFKAELLEVADRGTAAFQRWEPMLHQILGTASTMLDPFVDALEKAGDRLLPSIMTMMMNAGPAVDALADGISGTVDAVADVIDMLDDNGPEAAMALKAAFFLLESSIHNVGWVVNGLTEAFGQMIEFGLDFLGFMGEAGAKMAGLPGPLGAIGEKLSGLTPVTDSWRGSWEGLKTQITGATDAGADGTSKLSVRTQLLGLSMGAAVQQAGSLSAAFKLLNGGALDAREAESNYQAAIDNVTKSMKENGKTLDLGTEKGRNNDAAIRQLVASTDAKAQSTYDSTLATKGAAAAEEAAKGVYEQGRAQLVKNLTQLLGNAGAANKMADEIMGIPTSWKSTVGVDTAAAQASVVTIKKAIGTIKGKTVYVTVVERTQKNGDVHLSGKGGSGTQVAGAALGGRITGGSGWKDDVPLMTMGGEWVIQKKAVRALERQFGPDYMSRLNTWHLGGRGGPGQEVKPLTGIGPDGLARSLTGARSTSGGRSSHVIDTGTVQPPAPMGAISQVVNIGTVTLDASRMKSIQDVVELVSNIQTTARSLRARVASVPGR